MIADPAVLRPLRDWQAEQRQFVGLSLFTMKPLKGTLAVCVPSEFVSRLVDYRESLKALPPAKQHLQQRQSEAEQLQSQPKTGDKAADKKLSQAVAKAQASVGELRVSSESKR